MKKPCPYCGEKITEGCEQCEHCGKSFNTKRVNRDKSGGPTDYDYWETKRIPTWVMAVVVIVLLLCLVLLFVAR